MKQFLIKMVEEQPGEVSTMRIMALLCVCSGVLVSLLGLYLGKPISELAVLVGVHFSAGLGAKVGQKAFEQK